LMMNEKRVYETKCKKNEVVAGCKSMMQMYPLF